MLRTRQPVPALRVPLLGGGDYDLAAETPANFSMVVFYRGRHCPLCATYLKTLEAELGGFADLGVAVVAISGDGKDRAADSAREWGLSSLRLGHGLTLEKAAEWGLYISSARNEKEPARFAEPGLFLIRPDGELFFAQVQSGPFTRPDLGQLRRGVKFAVENGYPARGEVDLAA